MTLRFIACCCLLVFSIGCAPADNGGGMDNGTDDESNTTALPTSGDVQLAQIEASFRK